MNCSNLSEPVLADLTITRGLQHLPVAWLPTCYDNSHDAGGQLDVCQADDYDARA